MPLRLNQCPLFKNTLIHQINHTLNLENPVWREVQHHYSTPLWFFYIIVLKNLNLGLYIVNCNPFILLNVSFPTSSSTYLRTIIPSFSFLKQLMAENPQRVYPMAPAANNGVTQSKSDLESATVQSEELRRRKKMKYLTCGVAFAVFQTIVIVIFSLTVM